MSGFLDKNGKIITKLKRDKKELEVQIRREKKALQDYLDNILKQATDKRTEAAVPKAEATVIRSRTESSLLEQQGIFTATLRTERAESASLTKRQRNRQATLFRAKEGALRVTQALERKTWEEKNDVLTKKLTSAHAEVLHEREMWQIFRKRLLKEKGAVKER